MRDENRGREIEREIKERERERNEQILGQIDAVRKYISREKNRERQRETDGKIERKRKKENIGFTLEGIYRYSYSSYMD